MSRIWNEPVLISVAIRAIIFTIMAFGVQVTTEQLAAIMAALEAVLAVITRSLVTPNQLAEARVDAGGRPTIPMDSPED